MGKGKKIAFAIIAVIFALAVIGVSAFVSMQKKDYPLGEKMHFSMGTVVSQKLYGEGSAKHTEKIAAIVNALDDKISWRNADSAVSDLNKNASVKDTTLTSIIVASEKISRDSEGAFDITVGKISQLWAIGEEGENVPDSDDIEKLLSDVDYNQIKINGNTVTYDGKGSIDLGAVGKGAACDMVKSYLEASDLEGAVISVGGSILAWGQRNKAGDEWRIAIRHPRNENEILGVVSLSEGFVSTSGDYEKYFEKDGERYHHILDARTGYPADSGLISVTVVCDSGVLSDALSTACFILGAEKSKPLLEKYGASGIFVSEDMTVETVGDVSFER